MEIREPQPFSISIAGKIIRIDPLYDEVYDLCKGYYSNQDADIHIAVTEKDIKAELSGAVKTRVRWPESYLETLAVYRKICESMLAYDTFLMHGAVVAVDDSAFLFTAESGAGKTTHIRKWMQNTEDACVVNGDKPLIRIVDNMAIACGTPWCGKEHMSKNTMIPLKAIVLMERGEDNAITKISFGQAFPFLVRQTYFPTGSYGQQKTLSLLMRLNTIVQCYRFVFNNMKQDAFETSYTALTGRNLFSNGIK